MQQVTLARRESNQPHTIMAKPRLPISIVAAFASLILTVSTEAATFCVTTKVFDGASLQPFEEHRILFDNGLVYDLPQIESRLVTIFDEARGQVILLDRQNRVKTTLETEFLLRAAAQTRADATTPQKRQSWGLDVTVAPSNRVIGYTIAFGNLEYHTTTQTPQDPVMAVDYARFAILASRLNIVRGLGPPPFGRMTLNEYIANKKELPLETTLTVRREKQASDFRSTHEVEELSQADRKRIDEIRGMLELYQEIDYRAFQG